MTYDCQACGDRISAARAYDCSCGAVICADCYDEDSPVDAPCGCGPGKSGEGAR